MGLIADIQKDIQRITTSTREFAVPVIFSVTDGVTTTTVTCNALTVKHSLEINEYGAKVMGRNSRVSVSELALNDLEYPVRDTNNKVNLLGHTVTWTDVSGVQATYEIRQQYPDETTGLILCQLGDFGAVTPPGGLIIGWIVSPFRVVIVDTVDPDDKQTLANGDEINVQYTLNDDGTLTIPYLVDYPALSYMLIDNNYSQNIAYDKTTGTFDASAIGGFLVGNVLTFDASIPIWQQ